MKELRPGTYKIVFLIENYPYSLIPRSKLANPDQNTSTNMFRKNQLESLILSYKDPHKDSYSNTINDFKIRTLELANWLKFLRQA